MALGRRSLTVAAVVGLAKADAAAMGVVAPALRSHLHVSEVQLGLLASIAAATGALLAVPAGGLVDHRRRIPLVATAAVAWSAGLALAGFAKGVLLLAVARVVSGGVATVARPAAVSLIGDWYPPSGRGRALATLDTGQTAGTAVCFVLGALAVRVLDWRWLFWGLSGLGILLAWLCTRVEEPPRTTPPVRDPVFPVLRSLVAIPTNRIVLAADSVGNFFYAGAASFAVLFVSLRYHLTNATVDAVAPLLAVGVVAGILAGGRLGDHLVRQSGGGRRIRLAALCQLTATGFFACSLLCSSVVTAGALLFVASAVLGGAGPCLDAVRVDIVPAAIRGRAEAARGLLLLASSALGPLTFGYVATAFGGRGDGLALRDAFLVMLGPLAVAASILLFAARTYEPDSWAAAAVGPSCVDEGQSVPVSLP